MDSQQFDDRIRFLAGYASRRGLLAGLASVLLAVLPLALARDEADANRTRRRRTLRRNERDRVLAARRKRRKKKRRTTTTPPPPPCIPQCAGKTCGDDGCGGSCGSCGTGAGCVAGTCLCLSGYKVCPGFCVPQGGCCSSAECLPGSGEFCQSGTCACAPGQELSGGLCAPLPTCSRFNTGCTGGGEDCCSGECDSGGGLKCARSTAGEPCHATLDCVVDLTCIGFVCRP